jgi:hypothetical protein
MCVGAGLAVPSAVAEPDGTAVSPLYIGWPHWPSTGTARAATPATGSSGLGMEAGHMSVDPRGRPCRCGSRGCLDVETDALSLLDAAGRVPRLPARYPGPERLRRGSLAPDPDHPSGGVR